MGTDHVCLTCSLSDCGGGSVISNTRVSDKGRSKMVSGWCWVISFQPALCRALRMPSRVAMGNDWAGLPSTSLHRPSRVKGCFWWCAQVSTSLRLMFTGVSPVGDVGAADVCLRDRRWRRCVRVQRHAVQHRRRGGVRLGWRGYGWRGGARLGERRAGVAVLGVG
ncbi:hypothetical protein XF_0489 [Xylella fastidiosa 9a5c]|uniref:Uncharacterized protein n=1 Tax=Xylella fastidiosa (strain 9a5c) TaxID=160492 RepID=Q9PG13_XYLFA|nr:hypothetical protein XF_0489 [Xylella fastidiosa 9a5c]